MAISVKIQGDVQIFGTDFHTSMLVVPGIVSGAAYAAGDAMGTKFAFKAPEVGVLRKVACVDQDKEGIAFYILFWSSSRIDGGTDNSAFDMTDSNSEVFQGFIEVSTFAALSDNSVAMEGDLYMPFVAPDGLLTAQLVTRGAPNFTAPTDMRVAFAGDVKVLNG